MPSADLISPTVSCRPIRASAWSKSPLRLRLRPLRPVLAARLLASLHADRVERPADDVVPDARQVLHASPADQHDRVLLQVVPHARNVRRHLDAVGQPDARDLAQRRVRLLRRRGENPHANAALLRRSLKGGAVCPVAKLLAPITNELAYRRQTTSWRLRRRHPAVGLLFSATLRVYGNSLAPVKPLPALALGRVQSVLVLVLVLVPEPQAIKRQGPVLYFS